jgi:cytidine deaminase
MSKFNFQLKKGKKLYDIPDKICREMLQLADKAMTNCFPIPNKGFAVTVLTDKGNLYAGVSYNSDTYTLTMHSEATALAHAAIHGETNIIAITGPNCHICKQLIWESSLRSNIDVMIILQENGKINKQPISSMMPYPWPEKIVKLKK